MVDDVFVLHPDSRPMIADLIARIEQEIRDAGAGSIEVVEDATFPRHTVARYERHAWETMRPGTRDTAEGGPPRGIRP